MINLQKKKDKRGVRLNLGEEAKGRVDCWSPNHIVKLWEYQKEKEELTAQEEAAKLKRKI